MNPLRKIIDEIKVKFDSPDRVTCDLCGREASHTETLDGGQDNCPSDWLCVCEQCARAIYRKQAHPEPEPGEPQKPAISLIDKLDWIVILSLLAQFFITCACYSSVQLLTFRDRVLIVSLFFLFLCYAWLSEKIKRGVK